jgi:hypothetical protein
MTKVCDAKRREVKARRREGRGLVGPKGDILDGRRVTFCRILRHKGQGNVKASSQERKRIVAAWICVFAAVALYAPLAGAAWSAYTISCCTGDYCPIAQHHHQKKPASPHSDMDCGHDMGEMMNCSMSCCQGSENPLVTAVTFVLPNVTSGPGTVAVTSATETLQSLEILWSVQPLSPPPRFAELS